MKKYRKKGKLAHRFCYLKNYTTKWKFSFCPSYFHLFRYVPFPFVCMNVCVCGYRHIFRPCPTLLFQFILLLTFRTSLKSYLLVYLFVICLFYQKGEVPQVLEPQEQCLVQSRSINICWINKGIYICIHVHSTLISRACFQVPTQYRSFFWIAA